MTHTVRLAEPNDIPALMHLRTEAEQWLAEAGIDQWSNPDLGERAMKGWLQKINTGNTWVFINDQDDVVATASRGEADSDFWHPSDAPQSAAYIYKLIVARSEAGTRLGARILDWMSLIAAAEGREWLRLDVWRANKGLQQYYEKEGFDHVRTESPHHRLSGWLGQRRAGTVLHPEMMLPITQAPLPSDVAEQLEAIELDAQRLSRRVSELRKSMDAATTPVTGLLRWSFDVSHNNVVNSDIHLTEVLQMLQTAMAEAEAFPDASDPAWAAAPRKPVSPWGTTHPRNSESPAPQG